VARIAVVLGAGGSVGHASHAKRSWIAASTPAWNA